MNHTKPLAAIIARLQDDQAKHQYGSAAEMMQAGRLEGAHLASLRSGKLVAKPPLYISAYLGFCVYAGAIAAMFIWGLTL